MPQFSQPLCYSRLSRPDRRLFRLECVSLFIDCLYAEAVGAIKSCATSLASFEQLIWILAEFKSEARLRNCPNSVNFPADSKFLSSDMTSMWEVIVS
jgi:hypothetical protein